MARIRGMTTIGFGAFAVVGVFLAPACGSDSGTENGQNGLTAGTSGTSGTGNGGGGTSGTSGTAGVPLGGQTTVGVDANLPGIGSAQCSNGRDDDGDGQ